MSQIVFFCLFDDFIETNMWFLSLSLSLSLQVNGVSVVKVGHRQVVSLIRQGGSCLVMKVVSVSRKPDTGDVVRKKGVSVCVCVCVCLLLVSSCTCLFVCLFFIQYTKYNTNVVCNDDVMWATVVQECV